MQGNLERVEQDKAALRQKAKAKIQELEACMASFKAEVATQKQKVEAQNSKLLGASHLQTQLRELKKQLEELKETIAVKEGQLQEAAALKSHMAEVQSVPHLLFWCDCTGVSILDSSRRTEQHHTV